MFMSSHVRMVMHFCTPKIIILLEQSAEKSHFMWNDVQFSKVALNKAIQLNPTLPSDISIVCGKVELNYIPGSGVFVPTVQQSLPC